MSVETAEDLADTSTDSTAITDALNALAVDQPAEVIAEVETPAEETAGEPAAEVTEETAEAADLTALIDEATHKGLTQEQAEALGDSLPDFLAIMDKQAAALMRGEAKTEPGQEPERATEKPQAQESILPLGKLEAFEPVALDPAVHDEEVIKAHGSQAEHINKHAEQFNKLQELVGQLAQIVVGTHTDVEQFKNQTQAQSSTTEQLEWDEIFATLPSEYGDVFGKGPITNYSQESPQAKERQAVYQEAKTLKEVDAKNGRPPQTAKQRAMRALAYLKSEKGAAIERNKVSKTIAARRKAAIARPSGRSVPKGDDLASRRTRAMTAMDKILPRLGL